MKHGCQNREQLSTRACSFRDPALSLSAKQWVPANKHAGKTEREGRLFAVRPSQPFTHTSKLVTTALSVLLASLSEASFLALLETRNS